MARRRSPRVLVVVEGGTVQTVLADGPVTVLVKDWDNIKEGGRGEFLASDFSQPDAIVTRAKLDQERLAHVTE